MLSAKKLRDVRRDKQVSIESLADQIMRGGLNKKQAVSAIKNWEKGKFRPIATREDIRGLAKGLGVEVNEIQDWPSSYRFAPMSASKARLVTDIIAGRRVQDAMDLLKFTRRRASGMVNQVLKAAVADADEQDADLDELFVVEARVDDAGIRPGTKRWMPKDRGRAHPIQQKACHIHVTVTES